VRDNALRDFTDVAIDLDPPRPGASRSIMWLG
jgi:hypothetical protein